MVKESKVVIDEEAKKSIREAYNYIKVDSLQNAKKVMAKILAGIKDLEKTPNGMVPINIEMKMMDLSGLLKIYKYRITYYISDKEIRIIRFRHTKMNPLEY
ncbi:MAG: type II toxin-antitoxin system RelE/ParE family toxin [Ginsengibacter sp.]